MSPAEKAQKEQEYQTLIQRVEYLFAEFERVTKGRATNATEFKIKEYVRKGAVVGQQFKVITNKLKKQRRLVIELESLMRSHGGFRL